MTASAIAIPGPARPEALTSPPEARGVTDIADKVVERIATQVVADAEHAGGAARRLLGVALGDDAPDTAPQVTARVDGQLAFVQVSMSVAWPQSVREVTRRTRTQIINTVGELTGLDVRHVDIQITGLTTGGLERRVL